MRANRNLTVAACLACLVTAGVRLSGQEARRIDLREWGYKSRKILKPELPWHPGLSKLVSIGENSDVAVGFVTHDRWGLATRELPAFSFNVVRFTKAGTLLSQSKFPTPSREGALFYGADNAMLVYTGTKLAALSPQMIPVAEMELPREEGGYVVGWAIYPLPNGGAFLLYKDGPHGKSATLRGWDNLKVMKKCSYGPNNYVEAVADDSVLTMGTNPNYVPMLREVEVSGICGPSRFSYSWKGDPDSVVLLNKGRLFLAGGGPVVKLVVRGRVQWEERFDKRHDSVSHEVSTSSDGRFVAIAVQKFVGGSRLLDINSHLKAVRIIVYDTSSGKKVLEIPVEPTPIDARPLYGLDFALSPSGNLLAVLSDGFLEIVPVNVRGFAKGRGGSR